DAGRRARHDDVAGANLDLLRQLPDDFGNVPDQLGEVALLPFSTVHREPDLALGGMADLGSRLQRRAGRRMVERLADLPRPLLLARGLLQVAPREVDAHRIAIDVIERLLGRNVQPAALHGDDQLDLMMHVLGQRRIGDGGAVGLEHVGMLGKEKRRVPLVIAHLANMLEIVTADAPDAAYGKGFRLSDNRKGRLVRRGNDKGCGVHERSRRGYKGDRSRITRLFRPRLVAPVSKKYCQTGSRQQVPSAHSSFHELAEYASVGAAPA